MISAKNKRGFTLIEVMIVVAAIGLIASIAIMNITRAREKAYAVAIVSEMRDILQITDIGWATNGTIDMAELEAYGVVKDKIIGSYTLNLTVSPDHDHYWLSFSRNGSTSFVGCHRSYVSGEENWTVHNADHVAHYLDEFNIPYENI